MSFGENVTHYRHVAGLTQTQLSERVGCSRSAIARWASGDSEPLFSTGCRAAAILHITPNRLDRGPSQLARNLVSLRVSSGATKEQICEEAGIMPVYLDALECDGILPRRMADALIKTLATYWGCTPAVLQGEIDIVG